MISALTFPMAPQLRFGAGNGQASAPAGKSGKILPPHAATTD
jgi:hypothetical protein